MILATSDGNEWLPCVTSSVPKSEPDARCGQGHGRETSRCCAAASGEGADLKKVNVVAQDRPQIQASRSLSMSCTCDDLEYNEPHAQRANPD